MPDQDPPAGEATAVMGNRHGGIPRDAATTPTPTACTGESLAVVHMRGVAELQRHGDIRPAGLAPVHTIRAGGQHHGVVVAHFDPGWARQADLEPIGSVTTRDHHSLVVPYHRTAHATSGHAPTPTLTTHDRLALVVPYARSCG